MVTESAGQIAAPSPPVGIKVNELLELRIYFLPATEFTILKQKIRQHGGCQMLPVLGQNLLFSGLSAL